MKVLVSQHGSQPICVRVRERTGLHFEPVVPIASTNTLRNVATDCERAGLPLFDDMPILVEHQPGVVEELSTTSAQVDPASACGGNGPTVKPHEQRVLEDLDVMDRALEQHF